jgi:hypothetical protein
LTKQIKPFIGEKHNNLTLIELLPQDTSTDVKEKRRSKGLFQCECGEVIQQFIKQVRSGNTTSCGCQRGVSSIKHGLSGSREYKIWRGMKERCNSPKSMYYKYYGGRGITYTEVWGTFTCFWEDMKHSYEPHLELDRINVDKGYSKENCKWSTESEQAFRQRTRCTNSSGRTGVYYRKDCNKWSASIMQDDKLTHLGYFETFEQAVEVRKSNEVRIYGFSKD